MRDISPAPEAFGLSPGRASDMERIISVHLGLAAEDVATAKLIYDKAINENIGMHLPL